jgi:transcriptional regulator with XRE-family HTH domain
LINYWASFVFSYRRLHGLTQDQLADMLKVSQQTISRWEAGHQIPDPHSQSVLRLVLGEADLGSLRLWKLRVRKSAGHEFLLDRNLVILSASNPAFADYGFLAEDVLGQSAQQFIPKPRPEYLERVRDEGFFDGAIASVHVKSVHYYGPKHRSDYADWWPVLTSDAGILMHVTYYPMETPARPGHEGTEISEVSIIPNEFVGT